MRTAALAIVILFSLPSYLPSNAFGAQEWRQRASDAKTEVAQSDIAEEVRFGREVAARILGRIDLYDNAELNRYISLVGRAIALNAGRPELEFRFAVLDSAEINAYAAPGGYVFITRGALSIMKDEAELAGVLSHEIAHVAGRHIVRELGIRGSEDSPVSGLARLIGGGTESARTAFHQAADKAMDMLFKDGYKREDEAEADRNAAIFAALAGYDPAGLADYLERLKTAKGDKTGTLDKTHPPYDERVAKIRETIAKEGIDALGLKTNSGRFTKQAGRLNEK